MQNKKSVLVGYSGHGKVVGEAAILSDQNLRYYVEKNIFKDNPYDLEFLGNERSSNFKGFGNEYNFILAIGDNVARKKAAIFLESKNEKIICKIIFEYNISICNFRDPLHLIFITIICC